ARGRLVAYTDSDCVVQPGWLKALTAAMDTGRHFAGAGGRVFALDNRSAVAWHYEFHRVLEPPSTLQYLVTCNCVFLREALAAIGGFPEAVRTPGGEDVAAGILLYKKGWRFTFAPEAVVLHDFRSEISNFRKTWYNYGYGTAYFAYLLLHRDEL